jgi:uncharacterized sodium:solute symporter family permease YidK
MAKKNAKKDKDRKPALPQETKRAIVVIMLAIVGVFLLLAAFGAAGVAGSDTYHLFDYLLGIGYFLLPILFFVLAGGALKEESTDFCN